MSQSCENKEEPGHFRYKLGMKIQDYQIIRHLSDGTFGRVLEVEHIPTRKIYALKVIQAVKSYIQSAKEEATISNYLQKHSELQNRKFFVEIKDEFQFGKNYCMVFEKLGMSLYDFLKKNQFRGFSITRLQAITQQLLQAIKQMHSLELTHTDLKPENILFRGSKMRIPSRRKQSRERNYHHHSDSHTTVSRKRSISRSRSFLRHAKKSKNHQIKEILIPKNDEIKVIDFGGATFKYEHHTSIINTRQYRAPEVILQCCRWNEKSDVWSIACIIIELYSGLLYFNTHDNYEHLALIQKQFGAFPLWMIQKASQKMQDYFIFNPNSDELKSKGIYLNWPAKFTTHQNLRKVIKMKTYKQIISKEHKELMDLLDKMFEIDPKKRISCKDALEHQFFKQQYQY